MFSRYSFNAQWEKKRSCHSVPERQSSTIKRLHTCCTVRSMCEHALIWICFSTAQSNRRLQLLPCHNLRRCKVKGYVCSWFGPALPSSPCARWALRRRGHVQSAVVRWCQKSAFTKEAESHWIKDVSACLRAPHQALNWVQESVIVSCSCLILNYVSNEREVKWE